MLAIFLCSLFAALLIGVPIAFSLLASGSIMMAVKGLFDTKVVAQQVLGGFNGFTLLAMPFFVLAGEAMNKGGISESIVRAVMAIFGHIRGAFAALVVGLGCEPISAEYFAQEINARGGNATFVSVSEEKTYEEALEEGVAILRDLVQQASKARRIPCSVSKLTVAVRCGGSGAIPPHHAGA